MSAISSITESWNNHTFQEVETHIKGNYLPKTGSMLTSDFTIWNGQTVDGDSSPDTPAIHFQRGTTSGRFTDWKIISSGGSLIFEDNDLSGNWQHRVLFEEEGDIYAKAYRQSSDMRLKTILKDVNIDVNDISNAPLFLFKWKDATNNKNYIGTSAQYWKNVIPELVSEASDEMHTLSMQYDVIALASAITAAKTAVSHEERIKTQEETIKKQEERIKTQEEIIKAQEARIKALEDAVANIQSKLNN